MQDELAHTKYANDSANKGITIITELLETLRPIHTGEALLIPELELNDQKCIDVPSESITALRSVQVPVVPSLSPYNLIHL